MAVSAYGRFRVLGFGPSFGSKGPPPPPGASPRRSSEPQMRAKAR